MYLIRRVNFWCYNLNFDKCLRYHMIAVSIAYSLKPYRTRSWADSGGSHFLRDTLVLFYVTRWVNCISGTDVESANVFSALEQKTGSTEAGRNHPEIY